MEAVLVGRETELDVLINTIEKGGGAVVTGPAGIGKTRLVMEAAEATHRKAWWMPVTADSNSIPYGAFGLLMPELFEELSHEEQASPLPLIRSRFSDEDPPPLLVVDDAHHLDHASAATVHSLAVSGEAQVVATIRDGEPVPGAITALWKDAGLTRMDLDPLSREDATTLTTQLLGGAADVRTLNEIWRLTEGHPLELRELILSAQEAGNLTTNGEVWTINGSLNPTARLVQLVEERLGRFDPEERAVAETLAYGEPLDIKILAAACDPAAIESLERAGVIRVLDAATATQVTMAHPLYGEILRATLPATRKSKVAAALAEAAAGEDVPAPDPLRVATWRLDSGEATEQELESAAIGAVRRMAWKLTLRFATASLELAPSYIGHGCSATALAELGDPEGAEGHLRRAREFVDDPSMLALNTLSLADVWFYHAGRMEDALELVRKELAQTTDPAIRDEVSSALATNLMIYGNTEEVVELSREVLERPEASSAARFMALVASTSADGLMLNSGEVRSGVEAALPLVDDNRHRCASAEDKLHANVTVAELVDGDMAAARARVDQRLAIAVEEDRGDLPGFWTMFNGLVMLYEGQVKDSYETLLQALLLLERYDSWLSTPLARVGAARAAALMAHESDARGQIAGLSAEMRSAPGIRSRVAHVEALLASVSDGLTAGGEAALAAGDQATDDGHLLGAVEAWHLAVRLGRPDLVVGRLGEAASDRKNTVASLYHAHARALLSEDPEALEDVTRAFNTAGLALLAAETACQLCGLYRRRKEETLARRAAALATELLPEGSGARTAPFAELPDVKPLTRREREVALLAAEGMTSKDIADRLFLSIRSVDNHLSRVYAKLGVGGRTELSDVLIPGVAVSA